jgi:hypothetical protein
MLNATLPALRDMDDAGLAALWDASGPGDPVRPAVLAELRRRDRLAAQQRQRERLRAEWYDAAHAAYLRAESDCRGELVSRAGVAAGVRDGLALWSGPAWLAERYATEELRDWWRDHGRLTFGGFLSQRAASARAALEWTPGEPYAVPVAEMVLIPYYKAILRAHGRQAPVAECTHRYLHETPQRAAEHARRLAADLGLKLL